MLSKNDTFYKRNDVLYTCNSLLRTLVFLIRTSDALVSDLIQLLAIIIKKYKQYFYNLNIEYIIMYY